MSEPEEFLARWDRRKRAAREDNKEFNRTLAAGTPESGADSQPQQPTRTAEAGEATTANSTTRPAVDLASLPPIDSITASTDIRGFLAPGVPAELRRAALRRAWSSDPAIRDFVGLAENQWDFTAPDQTPGFGALGSAEGVRDLAAKVFGEEPSDNRAGALDRAASAAKSGTIPSEGDPAELTLVEPMEDEANPKCVVQRSENIAGTDKEALDSEDLDPCPPRGHGGALPR